jgi:hypothetical protein
MMLLMKKQLRALSAALAAPSVNPARAVNTTRIVG